VAEGEEVPAAAEEDEGEKERDEEEAEAKKKESMLKAQQLITSLDESEAALEVRSLLQW
jgi:uncharacterized membrane protein YqiK